MSSHPDNTHHDVDKVALAKRIEHIERIEEKVFCMRCSINCCFKIFFLSYNKSSEEVVLLKKELQRSSDKVNLLDEKIKEMAQFCRKNHHPDVLQQLLEKVATLQTAVNGVMEENAQIKVRCA